jgi:hypothetical protein
MSISTLVGYLGSVLTIVKRKLLGFCAGRRRAEMPAFIYVQRPSRLGITQFCVLMMIADVVGTPIEEW